MKQGNKTNSGLTGIFNSLSGIDKLKLRTAAAICVVPRIVVHDVKAHPSRSLLYTGFLGLYLLPVPLISVAVLFGLSALPTRWGRHVRDRFRRALDGRNIVRHMRPFMVEDVGTGGYKVANGALARYTTGQSLKDSFAAVRVTFGGLRYSAGTLKDAFQMVGQAFPDRMGQATRAAWTHIRNRL